MIHERQLSKKSIPTRLQRYGFSRTKGYRYYEIFIGKLRSCQDNGIGPPSIAQRDFAATEDGAGDLRLLFSDVIGIVPAEPRINRYDWVRYERRLGDEQLFIGSR